jgi:uncharacterized protein YecE (DUF72 family)
MRLLTGTSGYSYKAWKGPFYPEAAKDAELLPLYAARLRAVEINNTFYRMPSPSLMQRWADAVPDAFVFAVKAPQHITHRARLRDAGEAVQRLASCMAALGGHRGPVLFQLPPTFRADLPLLRDFLAGLPEGMRAAFEFRHPSWSSDAVHDALRARGAALCAVDVDEQPEPPLVPTGDFGYLRLRRLDYDAAALQRWVEAISAQPWQEVFAFFKHEDGGAAPHLALQLAGLPGPWREPGPPDAAADAGPAPRP